MIVLKKLSFPEQEELFTGFVEKIEFFIFRQNHHHKFSNMESVVNMLNGIADEINEKYETTAQFSTDGDRLSYESENMEYEICLLPLIFLQFRDCYRCAVRCHDEPNYDRMPCV